MNKKIFYGVAVCVVAAIAAWNVNFSSQTKGMSDISLSNVEALAQETTNCPCSCEKTCRDGVTVIRCCGQSDCRCMSGWDYVICDNVRASC